jgi:uncharacterized repeat protein (TIGR01451 family)
MKKHFPLTFCIVLWLSSGGYAQIPDYLPADSLVAWWPFNGNGNDESGNGHGGTVNGAQPTFDRSGNPNAAYFFNGVENNIVVNHHPDLNAFPITYSWWMKPQTNDDGGTVFHKYSSGSWNGYNISYWPSPTPNAQWEVAYRAGWHIGVYQTYGNPYDWANDANMFDNNWHHYVFVVDSLNGVFYKDGNVMATYPWYYESGPTVPYAVSGPWQLILGGGLRGLLDDLAIWKTNLSAEQVNDLYNASNNVCQARVRVYNDLNTNCIDDDQQLGLPGQVVAVNPGGYAFMTDVMGDVYLCDLQDGEYTVTIDTVNSNWETSCSTSQTVIINNGASELIEFAITNDNPCPLPDVTIVCPTIRRCSEHTWPIHVFICNDYQATGNFIDGYVLVELDDNILVDPATSPPYTMVGDLYRFEVGVVSPGECIDLVINANFSCDLEINETLCMEAALYPVPECLQDTVPVPGPCELPWDHSSLSVNGWCDENAGTVSFTVTNSGDEMDCFSEVRIYLDDELYATYYIQLDAESDTTFTFPSNEGTWILQADQHPLHPGNSHPNDHVEGCGDIVGEGDGDDDDGDGDTEDDDEWTPGLVDDLPSGDESPFVDDFCGTVVGSFDPNDKRGFPDGTGDAHEILPNEQLQYLIRFQNTGTAPAYTVVIRDTLDTDLDIFSITPGVSSHEYSFTMYGERVLQWTFNNIMLPDSFSNEEESHGFITYTVNQLSNLPDGTTINNSAAIFFDSNEPVITNMTLHTINHCLYSETQSTMDITAVNEYASPDGQILSESGVYTAVLTNAAGCDSTITINLTITVGVLELDNQGIRVFPIPASQTITAMWNEDATIYTITTPDGRLVLSGSITTGANVIDISALASGTYVLKADDRVTRVVVK